MDTHWRIKALAAVHIAIGPPAVWYGRMQWRTAPFALVFLPVVFGLALIMAQACLLGISAGLSAASWRLRVALVLLGSGYLAVLTKLLDDLDPFWIMPPLTAIVVGVVLAALQQRPTRPERLPAAGPRLERDALRFSIRGLMIFTAAIALAGAALRSVRGMLGRSPSLFAGSFWGVCFAVVCLAAVWAALGTGRPFVRSLVVLTLSAVAGAVMIAGFDDRHWPTAVYLISCHVTQAILVLASLFVVRSCGYRLVAAGSPSASTFGAPTAHEALAGCLASSDGDSAAHWDWV